VGRLCEAGVSLSVSGGESVPVVTDSVSAVGTRVWSRGDGDLGSTKRRAWITRMRGVWR